MANLTRCLICGEKYNYCPNCANTHAWKFYADTHEHYQIFMIMQEYNANPQNKEDARIKLENIGITVDTDLSNLLPEVAAQIKEMVTVAEKPVIKRSKKSKLFEDDKD